MDSPRKLIAGNWKMNGLEVSLTDARAVAAWLEDHPAAARAALCPPATLVARMADALAGSEIEVGAQDCSPHESGAYTGDVSAAMLADGGARLVILGHSERRVGHGEDDSLVPAKVRAALAADLEPIICVGESQAQRKAGKAVATVKAQIEASLPHELRDRPFSVAYEPVWAIGAGVTPSLREIEAVHAAIREALEAMFARGGRFTPILYGGSVNADNAGAILHARNVGGALVGGASLSATSFQRILAAA